MLVDYIAEIFGPSGERVGFGTLVTRCEIATCSHVVNVALGRSKTATDVLTDEIVSVRLRGETRSLVVAASVAPRASGVGGDACVLSSTVILTENGEEVASPATVKEANAVVAVLHDDVAMYQPVEVLPVQSARGIWQVNFGDGRPVGPGGSGAPVIDTRTRRLLGIYVGGYMATAQCFMIGTTTFRGMLGDMGVTMESSKATTNVRWLIEHSYRNTLNQLALDMSRAEDDGFQPKVCKSVKDSLKVLLQPLEELDSEVPGIGQATEEYRRVYKDWNDDADNPEARARHLRELRKRRADLKIVIDTNRDLISGSLETGALQGALEEVLDYTKEAPVALGKLRQEVRRTLQQIERASG